MDKVVYSNQKPVTRNQIILFWFLYSGFWLLSPLPAFGDEPSIHGFLQTNYSVRITGEKLPGAKRRELMLAEERGRLEGSYYPSNSRIGFNIKGDIFHDWVEDSWAAVLREGYVDYLMDRFDVRIGRQIITWGVGDMVFINDVFPKDWEAFYSGRPLEYLKQGVDAGRLGLYTDLASAEFIVISHFTPDNLPSAGRFFFFDPYPNIVARELDKPKETFKDTEYALRLYRSLGGFDLAAYWYKGFFQSPAMRMDNPSAPGAISHFYPRLNVYGASLQKNAFGGVVSAEYGYYDSEEDRGGKDPGIENSQSKFLVGYQKEFAGDLGIGIQYYGELMRQYNQFRNARPHVFAKRDNLRHYITARITKLLMYQTLKLSLFTFYSPNEEDFLVMPEASYKITDNLQVIAGMNIFTGADENTALGQHAKNSNIYTMVRYSF